MIILTLDAKRCMAELLLRETFDGFLFIEGEITTFNKFSIDGYVHKEFYGDASSSETVYSTWDKLRDFCFAIIKGKRTPLDFKFIFSLPDDAIRRLIEDKKLDFQPETVQGLYLNFRYNGSVLTCTTGTSLKIFTMDKSLEQAFDQWTGEFFSNHEVGWSVL
ncbi:MAG: DUF5721 family protein [Eubacteriales bacterium]|nr:DUF5721 family protein [Eubacteriales bacterium]